MALPGITFGSYTLNGLVQQISWDQWGLDIQEAHAFGVAGTSSIEGARTTRDFTVPIVISGFATALLRDAVAEAWEKLAGLSRTLQIRVGDGVVIFNESTPYVKLMGVKPEWSGVDTTHGHFRMLAITFRQLNR